MRIVLEGGVDSEKKDVYLPGNSAGDRFGMASSRDPFKGEAS